MVFNWNTLYSGRGPSPQRECVAFRSDDEIIQLRQEEERSVLTHAVAEKMIKSPRNIKYTKYQKNYTHSRGTPAKRNTSVDFGTYGLQCNEPTLLSLKQLETCRRTLRRVVARRAPI